MRVVAGVILQRERSQVRLLLVTVLYALMCARDWIYRRYLGTYVSSRLNIVAYTLRYRPFIDYLGVKREEERERKSQRAALFL